MMEAGYHRPGLAGTAMMRMKVIFSGKLKTMEWRGQEAELRVRCTAMNWMAGSGMLRSCAVRVVGTAG
jgi:hypothetical protein